MAILKRNTTKKTDAPKKEAAKKTTASKPAGTTMPTKRVLLGAHVSEKAASVESTGVYTFKVVPTATKVEIKDAIAAQFGIVPTTVRIMNVEGKTVRFGRNSGRRSDWKKAVVTLPSGKHIDIHSGI